MCKIIRVINFLISKIIKIIPLSCKNKVLCFLAFRQDSGYRALRYDPFFSLYSLYSCSLTLFYLLRYFCVPGMNIDRLMGFILDLYRVKPLKKFREAAQLASGFAQNVNIYPFYKKLLTNFIGFTCILY